MAARLNGTRKDSSRNAIPPPIHKFTTTNPSTQSPTYHLVYDLTSHKPTDSSPFIPVKATKNATDETFTQVNHNLPTHNPPYLPDTSPGNEIPQQSGPQTWDRFVNRLFDSRQTVNNSGDPTNLFKCELTKNTNYDSTERISTFYEGPDDVTINLPRSGKSVHDYRPSGDLAGYKCDNTNIISSFIDSEPSASSNRFYADADRTTVSQSGFVNTARIDTTNISKTLRNTPRQFSPPRQKTWINQLQDRHQHRFHLSKPDNYFDDISGLDNHRLDRVFSDNEVRFKWTDSCGDDSDSRGLTVKGIVSVWDNFSSSDADNKPGKSTQTNTDFQETKPVRSGLYEQNSEEVLAAKTGKHAIFKRDGDRVRLFIVGNGNPINKSVEVCENGPDKWLSNSPDTTHQFYLSPEKDPNSGLLNIPAKTKRSSNTTPKIRAHGKKTSAKFRTSSKTVDNCDRANKAPKPSVGRKPINRWETVEIKTAPADKYTSASCDEAPRLTIEVPAGSTSSLHKKHHLKRDVALRSTNAPEEDGRFKETENRAEERTIKNVSGNKDSSGNNLPVHGGKLNSGKFIGRSVADTPSEFYDFSQQFKYGISDTAVARSAVIDVSKYIIKPLDVQSKQSNLRKWFQGLSESENADFQTDNVSRDSSYSRKLNVKLGTKGLSQSVDVGVQGRQSFNHFIEDYLYQPVLPSTVSFPFPSSGELIQTRTLGGSPYNTHTQNRVDKNNNFASSDIDVHIGALAIDSESRLWHDTSPLYGSTEPAASWNRTTVFKSRTDNPSLSEDLRCSTVLQNVAIDHSSIATSDNGEISGDETLRYRRDLRERCQRHHPLNLNGDGADETSINNSYLLKDIKVSSSSFISSTPNDITTLGSSSFDLSLEKENGKKFQQLKNSRQKSAEITPCWIFETPNKGIAETIAEFLQLNNSSETSSTLKTPTQNKESPREIGPGKNSVPRLTVASHKESPRARFERDRAARAYAVTINSRSSRDELKRSDACSETVTLGYSCGDKCDSTEIQSCLSSQKSPEFLTPLGGLSSTTGSTDRGLRANPDKFCGNNEQTNLSQLYSDSEDKPIGYSSVSRVRLGLQFNPSRQTLQPNEIDDSGLLPPNQGPTNTGHVSVKWVDLAKLNDECLNTRTFSGLVNSNVSTNIGVGPALDCEQVNYRSLPKGSRLCVHDSDRPEVGNASLSIGAERRDNINIKLKSVFDSKEHSKAEDTLVNPDNFVRKEFTNKSTCVDLSRLRHQPVLTASVQCHQPVLTASVQCHQQNSALTDTAAVCDSSRVYINESSSPVVNVACNESDNTSNIFMIETKACPTYVNQLQTATGHHHSSDHSYELNYFSDKHEPQNGDNSTKHTNSLNNNQHQSLENSVTKIVPEKNGLSTHGLNSSPFYSRVVGSVETKMLASRGLRIYESRDDLIMSPGKSSYFTPTTTPHFQWEGTTYLILPTVVESLPTATPTRSSNSKHTTTNNSDLLAQRSLSDSGVSLRPSISIIDDDFDKYSLNDKTFEENEDNGESLALSSRSRRLSFNHRSMSVDVLCPENEPNGASSILPQVLPNNGDDNGSGGRGYVEWRTCSEWLQKSDTRTIDGTDSRGYVKWDAIWPTSAPGQGEKKDDEHVYDVIGETDWNSSSSEGSSLLQKHSLTPVTMETPPAVPERTYINRLRSSIDDLNSKGSSVKIISSSSSSSSHRHRSHHHHSHSYNHDNSCCRKHHHHHHHHHHHQHHRSNKIHKDDRSLPSSSSASSSINNSTTSSLLLSPNHHEHVAASTSLNQPQHQPSKPQQVRPDEPQNYAKVHKLRGYKFSNLIKVSDPPAPHHPSRSAIYSENYWHLAPVTSPHHVTTWQTGDVLDYIDGLHDSMSPKRRENIYILLNNKQTRAKFSESLEIESRLLSKGLISASSAKKVVPDMLDLQESGAHRPIRDVAGAEIVNRKGALAPVSSTYV